ncbi:hypothetical protein IFM89_037146 [Coptis chinensis]|uniref:Uncharacterized protein n=1 Tax=Coptis chinensis TaxID=261450 RepID=A0A835HST9_9MAGN|nr:hypothetical protein IFM89_037146 [Coptis chinensis]
MIRVKPSSLATVDGMYSSDRVVSKVSLQQQHLRFLNRISCKILLSILVKKFSSGSSSVYNLLHQGRWAWLYFDSTTAHILESGGFTVGQGGPLLYATTVETGSRSHPYSSVVGTTAHILESGGFTIGQGGPLLYATTVETGNAEGSTMLPQIATQNAPHKGGVNQEGYTNSSRSGGTGNASIQYMSSNTKILLNEDKGQILAPRGFGGLRDGQGIPRLNATTLATDYQTGVLSVSASEITTPQVGAQQRNKCPDTDALSRQTVAEHRNNSVVFGAHSQQVGQHIYRQVPASVEDSQQDVGQQWNGNLYRFYADAIMDGYFSFGTCSVWIVGRILASLGSFQQMWLSKAGQMGVRFPRMTCLPILWGQLCKPFKSNPKISSTLGDDTPLLNNLGSLCHDPLSDNDPCDHRRLHNSFDEDSLHLVQNEIDHCDHHRLHEKSLPYLPDDIIMTICSKLTVKSVFPVTEDHVADLQFVDEDNDIVVSRRYICPKKQYEHFLIGSYNGFLLFRNTAEPSSVPFIWNPITQEEVNVVAPDVTYEECGIFLHSPTGEYRIMYTCRTFLSAEFVILSLCSKLLRKVVGYTMVPCASRRPVILRGALHWMVSEGLCLGHTIPPTCSKSILVFKMDTEEFLTMPHPGGQCCSRKRHKQIHQHRLISCRAPFIQYRI